MGSKSSSKASTTSTQIDNRIAATDSAVVVAGGSTLTLTDPGLIQLMRDTLEQTGGILGDTISSNEKILLEVLEGAGELSIGALQAIGSNADKAFEFVDKQRQDEDQRTARTTLPWLVAGASVLAIAWAIKGGK